MKLNHINRQSTDHMVLRWIKKRIVHRKLAYAPSKILPRQHQIAISRQRFTVSDSLYDSPIPRYRTPLAILRHVNAHL
jgi:hypothetical protein